MAPMAAGPPRIEVPRWIQLVGLPVLLLLGWVVAGAVRHVVFIFVVAGLIALLLNPLVRGLGRFWIPRGVAVALVYLAFATLAAVGILALATVVVNETKSASNRIDSYFTEKHGQPRETDASRDLDRLQRWLNAHHLEAIKVKKQGNEFLNNIGTKDIQRYTGRAISFVEGAAISTVKLLFTLVLIIVVSIYMLLDMSRLAAAVDRRWPPQPGSLPLLLRMEESLVSYVKGQALVSVVIAVTAGVGLYLLDAVGLFEGGQYALVFASWVAVTELIPYLGPWLGAIPPIAYALVTHPISALWVALLFLGIHQIEGHIVVPKLMGNALRLHPLLVIFGLLAGGEIYGLPGALIALPLLATARAAWEFFSERVVLEPWHDAGVVPVPIEPDGAAGAEPPGRRYPAAAPPQRSQEPRAPVD
jgi:predicted PurR-regulated permease PerM